MKAVIQDTHKFESYYDDRLLFGADGRLPDEGMKKIIYARSPLHHAEKSKAATLHLQGLEDKIVPPYQAERMTEVIKKHNGNAKVVFFEGEGHGFVQGESIERSNIE